MGDEFKTGDVVTLKSGGPEMTVNGHSPEGLRLRCSWFMPVAHASGIALADAKSFGSICEADFYSSALKAVAS